MKIFLTGEKQIGKSTILRKYIDLHKKLSYAGFCSSISSDRNSIAITPMTGGEKIVVAKRVDGKMLCEKAAFDNLSKDVFTPSSAKGVLVLDELGFVEEDEKIFQENVIQAIESFDNVIGVIRNDAYYWKDMISKIPGVQIIEVTLDNRDSLEIK